MLLKENLTQANTGERITAKGYAVAHKNDTFKPFSFSRHALGENDTLILKHRKGSERVI